MAEKSITIWIDADSCPSLVRNHTVKMGNRLGIKVVFAANKKISCDTVSFEMIICEAEKDAADNYISENCKTGDTDVECACACACMLTKNTKSSASATSQKRSGRPLES